MSGEELTTVGDEHSERVAGLVYLDAADDLRDFPGSSPTYMALFEKLPEAMRANRHPTDSDLKSFQAFDKFKVRSLGSPYPEAELHNSFECNADGSVGKYRTADEVHNAIGRGALKRDYSRIRVPILAFFGSLSVNPRYHPRDAKERAAMEEFDAATDVYEKRYRKSLQAAKGGVHIVDLPMADHYLFLSNQAEVLQEIHIFLEALR